MTHVSLTSQPTVHLTVGRSRRKTYGPAEYRLRDGEEYELEIHNTTQGTVGARVRVEGRPIGQTLLVLRPGERVYLERWMDRAQKFRFSTYTVDGSPESAAATANNGRVTVEFFREQQAYVPPVPDWTTVTYGSGIYAHTVDGRSTLGFAGDSTTAAYSCSTGSAGSAGTGQHVNSMKLSSPRRLVKSVSSAAPVVTGRTEAGSASGQAFSTVDLTFESWAFHTASLRVLPLLAESAEDARRYCTSCGTRAKKASWRHCPSCGTAL